MKQRDFEIQQDCLDQINRTNDVLRKHQYQLEDLEKKVEFVQNMNKTFDKMR